MKLNNIKIGQLITLRKGKDAVLYTVKHIDGFTVTIQQFDASIAYCLQNVDYTMLHPTRRTV